ncbi:hypothetical protein SARC_09084 [Sphaeroforma arctica JP610]|uniref:Arp2/3 complex 34 kDa subunit n=1 Tax=Sphaeroforma arctica JP610 TaxID=667725 RepID=A0A0L0FPQ4_9EUKA|nr:hypothetical protein SARC_09084 [Sphaeroforma arctica JP610]KNC78491.1 hypothetical protein SARC_09084 [Sphaeroforma arctica JP610]|eukprot:XP_014152393.1 hypothetical protein SARC_09084 [Sphaeroforma arctica JP610]
MILLDDKNKILNDTLQKFLSTDSESLEPVDVTLADFDSVLYHMSPVEGAKSSLKISIGWPAFKEMQACGADDVLKRIYGDMITDTEKGYDFSIVVDSEALNEEKDEVVSKVALLKRNVFAAPFERAFRQQKEGGSEETMKIQYREDSSIWLQARHDRVTVVFSTTFQDADDITLANKVFLQEFVDAKKKVREAPQVIYSWKDPPSELDGTGAEAADNISYITFVLFPRHYDGDKEDNCINMLQMFRDYFHYHIKCSKAYLHTRMRARVSTSLKVLNRAKPEVKKDKKTFSGKTFAKR